MTIILVPEPQHVGLKHQMLDEEQAMKSPPHCCFVDNTQHSREQATTDSSSNNSKKKDQRRGVHFHEKVYIYNHIHRNDLTEQEFDDMWISPELPLENRRRRRNALKGLTSEECMRGLENRNNNIRLLSWACVFRQQTRPHWSPQQEAIAIATIYGRIAKNSTKYARQRATQDATEAYHHHF